MSSKKFRTTYILIATFIILFLFVYFYEKNRIVKNEDEIETHQIIQIDENEIKEIKFTNAEKETVVVKEEDGWKIIKPIKYQARQQKISEIIEEINNARSEQKIMSDDLSEYGFDQSIVSLLFIKNDGESIEIIFGGPNPQQTDIYVKTSISDEIFLVDSFLENRLRLDDEILKED